MASGILMNKHLLFIIKVWHIWGKPLITVAISIRVKKGQFPERRGFRSRVTPSFSSAQTLTIPRRVTNVLIRSDVLVSSLKDPLISFSMIIQQNLLWWVTKLNIYPNSKWYSANNPFPRLAKESTWRPITLQYHIFIGWRWHNSCKSLIARKCKRTLTSISTKNQCRLKRKRRKIKKELWKILSSQLLYQIEQI